MQEPAEFEKTKAREAPWIHPEAVADLIRSGEAQRRDWPALIRLYIRAKISWYGRLGKSGQAGDYWEDNRTIAENLGVYEHDIQNALRGSGIRRAGGGKGRGRDKRFTISRADIEAAKTGDGEMSDQHGASAESTSATRNNDVCQMSDQRVLHVESAPTTGLEGIGLEKMRMEGEGGGRPRADARQPKTPPPVSHDSFFRIGADEAMEYLNDIDLMEPRELARAYYGLIVRVCGASLTDGSRDDEKAALLLKGIPDAFRRQDVVASWMVWYVLRLGRRWDKATHYLTRFSASWDAYRPLVEEAERARLEEVSRLRALEVQAREEHQRREWEEMQKFREEEERREAERREAEEEAQRLRALEEAAFRKSLPSPEAVREAVGAVKLPAKGIAKFGGYIDFVDALLRSVPVLGLWRDLESHWCNPICNLLDKTKGNQDGLEQRTREFVASGALCYLAALKRESHVKMPKLEVTSGMFVEYFGVDREYRITASSTPKAAEGESGLDDLIWEE